MASASPPKLMGRTYDRSRQTTGTTESGPRSTLARAAGYAAGGDNKPAAATAQHVLNAGADWAQKQPVEVA